MNKISKRRKRLVVLMVAASLYYYYSHHNAPLVTNTEHQLATITATDNILANSDLESPDSPVLTSEPQKISTTIDAKKKSQKKVKHNKADSTQTINPTISPALVPEPNATSELSQNQQAPDTQSGTQNIAIETKKPAVPQQTEDTNASAKPELQKSETTPKTRTITIKNGITPKMLAYSHWTGKYKPTTFSVSVDGHSLTEDNEFPVDITDNKLTVTYRYSFMKGYKTGARSINFKVDPEATTVDITFAWKNKWHILCDHATPESAEEIEFKE